MITDLCYRWKRYSTPPADAIVVHNTREIADRATAMLPLPDPVFIRDEIMRLAELLAEACDDDFVEPRRLTETLSNVLDTLQCRERSANEPNFDEEPDPSVHTTAHAKGLPLGELGDHAVDLLAQLADTARRIQLAEEADALDALLLPLACCVARAGGELTRISPVVNAAAAMANTLWEPNDITSLFRMIDEVFHAVSPKISDAAAGTEDARIWRVLVINRAIMATRTHRPALMETAFDSLIEHATDDAAAFFREGMGQMDALDYPAAVRIVMQRYHDAWSTRRRLH